MKILRVGAVFAIATLLSINVGISVSSASSTALTLDGVVRTVAADTVAETSAGPSFNGHSNDVYRQVLIVGDVTYVLKGKSAPKSNSHVQVTGTVVGNTIDATDIVTLGSVAGISSSGTTRVLAMLVEWPGNLRDTMTQATASSQLFTDTNGWYREASYGALGQTGATTPWLSIAGPTSITQCYAEFTTIMAQAKAAAQGAGYVLSDYENFIVYFPHCSGDSAGYAGWAYVGSSGVWLNGYLDRRVNVHEQGHNYGLWHSHSNMCSSGGTTGTCTFLDYGDDYDAMGSSSYVGHFNGSQKTLLGWMSAHSTDFSGGGSATLAPMELNTPSSIIFVSVAGTNTQYWAEYRQPLGYDSALPAASTDGVLIHVSGTGSGSGDSGASLIDVRPSDGISTTTAALQAGQSWTSTEGITFTVGGVTSSGAVVTVSGGPTTQYPLTVSKTGPGSGSVTSSPGGISCGATCAANYSVGTSVTLTEVPTAGSTFTGWSAPCTGTGTSCTIAMTAAQSVTASFAGSATTTYQESAAHYTGTWTTSTCTCFSGGTTKYAKLAGATASFTFTGSSVSFLSERKNDRGSFKVYLDGVYKTTVSNYITTASQNAVAVWTKGFTTPGTHTLKILVVGTPGHPRVDVDAFTVTTAGTPSTSDWSAYMRNPAHTSGSFGDSTITTTNATSLSAKWRFTPGTYFDASPTVVGNMVYIAGRNAVFYALNATTGVTVWSKQLDKGSSAYCPAKGSIGTATVDAGVVYAPGAHYLYALDAMTGAQKWKTAIGPATTAGSGLYLNWASPTVAGGRIFMGLAANCERLLIRGGVISLSEATGAVQHTYYTVPTGKIGGSVWSSEASDGQTVWATTGNPDPNGTTIDDSYSIFRLDAASLTKLDKWTVPAGQAQDLDFGSSPTLFSNAANTTKLVGACNKNGILYVFNQSNLAAGPLWSRAVAGSEINGTGFCITSPVWDYSSRKLYVATQTQTFGAGTNGAVYELDPDNGTVLWQTTLACGVTGTPVINGLTHLLAVGQANCPSGTAPSVKLFNETTGQLLATIPARGNVFAQPVFANGHLYIADEGGSLTSYAP